MKDFSTIWMKAKAAATAAAFKKNDELGPEAARGFDCGFAWVTVRPARGPFISWCKACGYGRTGGYDGGGGYGFWYSNVNPVPTQSDSVEWADRKSSVTGTKVDAKLVRVRGS